MRPVDLQKQLRVTASGSYFSHSDIPASPVFEEKSGNLAMASADTESESESARTPCPTDERSYEGNPAPGPLSECGNEIVDAVKSTNGTVVARDSTWVHIAGVISRATCDSVASQVSRTEHRDGGVLGEIQDLGSEYTGALTELVQYVRTTRARRKPELTLPRKLRAEVEGSDPIGFKLIAITPGVMARAAYPFDSVG
nr:hypothetical protein B0A51_13997 [Rachicladosporium sp. CCFEE 5018]